MKYNITKITDIYKNWDHKISGNSINYYSQSKLADGLSRIKELIRIYAAYFRNSPYHE